MPGRLCAQIPGRLCAQIPGMRDQTLANLPADALAGLFDFERARGLPRAAAVSAATTSSGAHRLPNGSQQR